MSPCLRPSECLGHSYLPRFLDPQACPSGRPLASPTAAVSYCCPPSAVAGTAEVLAWAAMGCAAGAGAAPKPPNGVELDPTDWNSC
eukprot:1159685-Pelagomonas_calceolata.AAC.8